MDVVALTQRLLAFATVNPPGNERECTLFVAGLLRDAGLEVRTDEFDEARTSLVATLRSRGERPSLVFTGHVDVVPLGAAEWSVDPFAGVIRDGRLYGRGSADMKGAVAAMIIAAQRLAHVNDRRADLQLIITAGEERGCLGAQHLCSQPGDLGVAGAMVVGEPTGNRPMIAHKGCLRLALHARGVTAHASMPEQGDNAIFKAAEAALALRAFDFAMPVHPLLGRPTLNVGTIVGGMNINSVPDAATIGVDIRTVAGQDDDAIIARLQTAVGSDIEIQRSEGASAVISDPEDPWIRDTLAVLAARQGCVPELGSAPYFTDAGFLKPALGDPPTLILGPGDAEMAHKTDEYCALDKLAAAVEIYEEIARRWCCA